MTILPVERRVRAGLPVVRFMQSYVPLPVANWLIRQGVASLRLDDDIALETMSAGGVPGWWIIPPDSPPDRALLYLHGGGFVFGVSPLHLQMGAYLARKMGMRILMVEYRLAPKYPFPAALDDCATSYRWLLDQGIPARHIVLAGDSAGGNLAITLSLQLRDGGDPLPAAAACLSPVTDLTGDREQQAYKDPLLPPRAMRRYSRSYVADHDARNPLISPVFGDLRGLPPLLIHAGEDEILCADAVRIIQLAQAAGVDARLEIYPRMWHVWQLNLELPQALQSLDDIACFLGSRVGLLFP
jgi:acetyl esterase/lipase